MGQSQIKLEYTSLDPECAGQRYWYAFLMSSLITFFGGIAIIYFWRLFRYVFFGNLSRRIKAHLRKGDTSREAINLIDHQNHHNYQQTQQNSEIGWVTSARDFCGELISGQSTSGRLLVCFCFIFLN